MVGALSRLWRTIRSMAARLDASRNASSAVWTVRGVVGPEGVCGERTAHGGDWMLRFSLSPWRVGNGLAVDEKLHVQHRCSTRELAAFQRALPPGATIAARVRLEFGATYSADLVELLEPRMFE